MDFDDIPDSDPAPAGDEFLDEIGFNEIPAPVAEPEFIPTGMAAMPEPEPEDALT
jgi:hypothetical protein